MLSDKVEVKRGNVYLTIASEDIDRYIAKGFDVLDADGNVIKKSIPNDLKVLQKMYEDQLEEIAKLKAEIETLKAQIKESGSKKASEPKPEVKSEAKATTKKASSKK